MKKFDDSEKLKSFSKDLDEYAPTFPILYRALSLIDMEKNKLMRPRSSSTIGGRIIRNERAYRRAGGTVVRPDKTERHKSADTAYGYLKTKSDDILKLLNKFKLYDQNRAFWFTFKKPKNGSPIKTLFEDPKSTKFATIAEKVFEYGVNLGLRLAPEKRFKVKVVNVDFSGKHFAKNTVSFVRNNKIVYTISRNDYPEWKTLLSELSKL